MNERAAARFFDGFADTFDSLYDGRRNRLMRWIDSRFRRDMFIRFDLTFAAVGGLAGKTVLDLGCGSGIYTVEALKRGASHVIAVDPAAGMLARLRRRLADAGVENRCTVVEGFFPGARVRKVDHAIVMGVMDYVEDAEAFLTALHALVGESAAVSFPSIHWFRTPLRRVRYRLRRCPLYFYDERRIREIARAAGFRGIEVCKIPGAGMDYHVCLRPSP
jgi:cyclopropane fatty-acyl-phospholipid synthase-like methyltransferase